jgi:hypothetical protein
MTHHPMNIIMAMTKIMLMMMTMKNPINMVAAVAQHPLQMMM